MLHSTRTVDYNAERISCVDVVTYLYPSISIKLRILTWCVFYMRMILLYYTWDMYFPTWCWNSIIRSPHSPVNKRRNEEKDEAQYITVVPLFKVSVRVCAASSQKYVAGKGFYGAWSSSANIVFLIDLNSYAWNMSTRKQRKIVDALIYQRMGRVIFLHCCGVCHCVPSLRWCSLSIQFPIVNVPLFKKKKRKHEEC